MSISFARQLAAVFSLPTTPAVVVAYVFGSHASGRQHRESDIDIGVLLPWIGGEGAP